MAGALPGAACGVARRERAATRGMAGARRGRDVRVEAGRHAARRISPCGMPRHERGMGRIIRLVHSARRARSTHPAHPSRPSGANPRDAGGNETGSKTTRTGIRTIRGPNG
ncbi:hypothetical protein DM45_2365 [Burkholderia mallei]|nr:hypothetical protein DM45_2365 [Burkholderia mallei]